MKKVKLVSFTGTRNGMTDAQKSSFAEIISLLKPVCFIHGDCLGADHDAHNLTKEHSPETKIAIRPCFYKNMRAYCKGDIEFPEKHPLDRNVDIVEDGELLIACPKKMTKEQTGGTWHTINFARMNNLSLIVIWPDGTLLTEEEVKLKEVF